MNCFKHGLWKSLFLSPALCFLQVVSQIRKGNIKAAWAIPFIMGFYAYLFPPFADFARALDRVTQMQDLPLSQVIVLCGDIIVPTIEYLFLKFHIPIEFFRFIYTFIAYYLITIIFVDIAEKYTLSNKRILLIWLFLFMQIEFFAYIDNIRTIFVRIALLYCFYQYYCNNSNKHRYYALLLSLVHFAYFPILILFFLSKYFKIKLSRPIRLLLSICIIFVPLFSRIIDISSFVSSFNFGEAINGRIFSYTEGAWSVDGDEMTSKSRLYSIYVALLSISTYYNLSLFARAKTSNLVGPFLFLIIIASLFTSAIPVLLGRYLGFVNIFISFFILINYLKNKVGDTQFMICLILYGFNTLLNVYSNWNCIVNGNVVFLLLPLPILLFQIYDFSEWCDTHLSEDFNTFINGNFLSR